MRNFHISVVGLVLSLGLSVLAATVGASDDVSGTSAKSLPKHSIVVTIRPNVEIDSRIIRVGDVATIACSDTNLRDKLKQLDLEAPLSAGESVSIDAAQIKFRIQVAGVEGNRISTKGNGVLVTARGSVTQREPETVKTAVATSAQGSVSTQPSQTVAIPAAKTRRSNDLNTGIAEEGSLEREIIQAAQSCVLNKLPWPADTIDIRLAQPLPADVRQAGSAEGYECTAELKSTGSAIGRIQIRVVAKAPQQPTFDVPIVLDVRHFDKVVVTSRSLERGHLITAADLYIDRQDVTEVAEYCSSMDELIGKSLKRSLRALQPVRMNELEAATQATTSVMVKRREPVKMFARTGGVSVEAMGEALQDGRLGEVIRVRNLESNVSVQGRVTRAGEVEISF